MAAEKKKTLLVALGIFFSLVLVVGVFFLVRQQSVTEPTPTPRPTPKAPEISLIDEENSCAVTFTVAESTEPTLACSKRVWQDEESNDATEYSLDTEITEAIPGEVVVFEVEYSATDVDSFTATDELSARLSFLDSASGCTYNSTTSIIECPVDTSTVKSGSVMFRATVDESIDADTTINNSCTLLDPVTNTTSSCEVDLAITVADTSADPSADPSGSPAASPSEVASASPTASQSPAAQSSATASVLPEAGIMTFTTGTIGAGAILLIIGFLGLLLI